MLNIKNLVAAALLGSVAAVSFAQAPAVPAKNATAPAAATAPAVTPPAAKQTTAKEHAAKKHVVKKTHKTSAVKKTDTMAAAPAAPAAK